MSGAICGGIVGTLPEILVLNIEIVSGSLPPTIIFCYDVICRQGVVAPMAKSLLPLWFLFVIWRLGDECA